MTTVTLTNRPVTHRICHHDHHDHHDHQDHHDHHDYRDLERVDGPPQPDLAALPGSAGEHDLQCAWGTQDAARRFYRDQVRDRLVPAMKQFVARMEMAFMATADARGECDATLRTGPPGFIHVLDDTRLVLPEYRGNGVHASLGNITENAHVGLLMVDFVRDLIGLHVNGRARIVSDARLRDAEPDLPVDGAPGRRAHQWLLVEVEEAYVHCRKHIPRMVVVPRRRSWGSNDPARKGGDYFGTHAAVPATTCPEPS